MAMRAFSALIRGARTLPGSFALPRGLASVVSSVEIEIPAESYAYHRLDSRVPLKTTVTKEDLIAFFKSMVTMRRVETVSENLYGQKLIRGFLHVYTGQEAVVTGVESTLKPTDSVITAYRDHCHFLARGGTVRACLAELMGRAEGCSKGKGGSMHMYLRSQNFYGGNGIVGAQVPVGAGIAFAHKYRGDGGVCWTYYGDGASNQGQVFEAYNMAQLWKLPVVFVCENNHYGMGTSVARAASNTNFYTRGDVVPGLKIDGMNVLAVREGARFATEFARTTGPIVVEFDTYRYKGHSMSDPGTSYRSRDEVDAKRKQYDCIEQVKNLLVQNSWMTAEEMKVIEKQVRDEVEAVGEELKSAPFPAPAELFTDVSAP